MLFLSKNIVNNLNFCHFINLCCRQKHFEKRLHSYNASLSSFKTFGPLFESLKYTQKVYNLSLPLFTVGRPKRKKPRVKSFKIADNTRTSQIKKRIQAIDALQKSSKKVSVVSKALSPIVSRTKLVPWPYRKKTKAEHYKRWKASRFYYRIVEAKRKQKRFKKWSFVQYSHNRVNKFRLYYTTSTQHQFSNLLSKFNTLKKNVISHFLMLLEGRLEFFLFRINFVPSIYFARQLIRSKGVLINSRIETSRNYILKPMEPLHISSVQFDVIFNSLLNRLLLKKILLNYPLYAEVDYATLSAMFIQFPKPNEVVLPFSLEQDLHNRKLHYVYNKI